MTTPSPINFSYSGSPSDSDLDEVRFLVQDTDSTNPLLSDEEIAYLQAKWYPLYGSNTFVASVAAGVLARKFASAVSVSADGVSVQMGDLSAKFATMAEQLRSDYQEERDVAGLPDLTNIMLDIDFDPSILPLEFAIRLNDNREAGRQSYGGYLNNTYPHGYSDPLYGSGY